MFDSNYDDDYECNSEDNGSSCADDTSSPLFDDVADELGRPVQNDSNNCSSPDDVEPIPPAPTHTKDGQKPEPSKSPLELPALQLSAAALPLGHLVKEGVKEAAQAGKVASQGAKAGGDLLKETVRAADLEQKRAAEVVKDGMKEGTQLLKETVRAVDLEKQRLENELKEKAKAGADLLKESARAVDLERQRMEMKLKQTINPAQQAARLGLGLSGLMKVPDWFNPEKQK